MEVAHIFELYKQGVVNSKKLVFCNFKTQDGFEVNNLQQFEAVMEHYEGEDLYVIEHLEQDDFSYFEFFILEKGIPTVAVVRHPFTTNAYWKDKPDRILDMEVVDGNIYRFINVDYGRLLKDYIIELPLTITDEKWSILQARFPAAFGPNLTEPNNTTSISVVFSNTDRLGDSENLNFYTYPLSEIYPEIKRPQIKAVAQKLWKELKES